MDKIEIENIKKYLDCKYGTNTDFIKTGIEFLDNKVDGYYKGTIWVIGGWPGAGKTTFSINLLRYLKGTRVSVFDTETSKYRYIEKLMCCLINVKDKNIRTNEELSIKTLRDNLLTLNDYDLHIIDKSNPSIKDIEDELKSFIPRIVIIDYFQNLEIPGGQNRYAEFTNLARKIEQLTKKYGCTTILTSQLKKPTEMNLRPTKFDLKETGKLGEMARVVVLLSHLDEDEDGELFIDIQKARDGSLGCLKIKGDWETNRLL